MLARAEELYNFICSEVDGLEWIESGHTHLAAACFHVVLDHFAAVLILARRVHPPLAPIAALLRPQMEAYLRALWLWQLATDEEADKFWNGKIHPSTDLIIKRLEDKGFFDKGSMSRTRSELWSALCSYTHSGIELVVKYISKDAVEPNYTSKDISALVLSAEGWALMASIGIAGLAAHHELTNKLLHLGSSLASSLDSIDNNNNQEE